MKAKNFAKKHGFKPMLNLNNTRHLDVGGAAMNGVSVYRYMHDLTRQIMILAECNGETVNLGRDYAGNKMGNAYRIFKDVDVYSEAYDNWSRSGDIRYGDVRITCSALADCGIRNLDHQDGDEYPLFGEYGE